MFDEQMEAVISWPFEFVLKKPATVFGRTIARSRCASRTPMTPSNSASSG